MLGTFAVRDATSGVGVDLPLAPRQTALLACLALARPRGRITRDGLLGIFWAELPQDRARAALSNSLYRLRVELGHDIVVSAGDTHVELQWDRVQCDVLAFEAALDHDNLELALGLYQGELLAGFHLVASAEFGQWLDGERERVRQRALQAALTLAQRFEAAGNPAAASNWLRCALGWAPHSEPLVRDLCRYLTAVGDRSGAIKAYEVFAARLANDLELEPSASLQTAIASLRVAEEAKTALAPAFGPQPPQGVAEIATPVAPTTDQTQRSRLQTSLAAVVLFGLLGAALLVSWHAARGGDDVASDELRPNRVLVLPLENRTGDDKVTTMGRMAADWVTQSLQRTGLVEVIDPNTALLLMEDSNAPAAERSTTPRLKQLARLTRAGIIVGGSVSRLDGGLVFQVQIMDAREGKVLRALNPVRATDGDLEPALETLRIRVAGALATIVDQRLASVVPPSGAPPTFDAYQEYALGLDQFRPNSMPKALVHFMRAAELDSTFVQARFWAAWSMQFGQPARRDSLVMALAPLRERMTPTEQAGLDMFVARTRGDWEVALRAARRAARLTPQSIWSHMAAVLALELGRPREALADLADLDPSRSWVKGWRGYWLLRIKAHHRMGEHEEALALVRLARQNVLAPENELFDFNELAELAALGRVEEMDQRLAQLVPANLPEQQQNRASNLYRESGWELRAHGNADKSRRHFERCIELNPVHTSCMYDLGRYVEGYSQVRARSDLPEDNERSLFAARLGHRADAERFIAEFAARYPPFAERQYWVQFHQARIASILGQRERAAALLRSAPWRGRMWDLVHSTGPDFEWLRNDHTTAALFPPPNKIP